MQFLVRKTAHLLLVSLLLSSSLFASKEEDLAFLSVITNFILTSNTQEPAIFREFHVGVGGASAFPFASINQEETIWVSIANLIADEYLADNGYYAQIEGFDGGSFVELQGYLQHAKFFTIWVTQGWEPYWYNRDDIQLLMNRGAIPIFIYRYFGDSLIQSLPTTTQIEAYRADTQRLGNFLSDFNGTKMVIFEPSFNQGAVMQTQSNQEAFASMVSDAIETLKSSDREILFSLSMLDIGSRHLFDTNPLCGYAHCALGDQSGWEKPSMIYEALQDKLDFVSFNEILSQFSRNYENPGEFYAPNPRAFSEEEVGVDYLALRIGNLSQFLHDSYKKPTFLSYLALSTATWSDDNLNGEIESSEVDADGWLMKSSMLYEELRQMQGSLQESGLFGFAIKELFDHPRYEYGSYQYFLQSGYHFGIVGSGALDESDGATHGDLEFKDDILESLFGEVE
jgi:hypothetical protein